MELGGQRWSLRGPGTDSPDAENWGRYQPPRLQIVDHWHQIGTVMQGPAIDTPGAPLPAQWYLETQSQLEDTGLTPVVPFPNIASILNPDASTDYPNVPTQLDERSIFYQMINNDQSSAALAGAKAFVDSWLAWSQEFSLDPSSPEDQLYFEYSEQAFEDRINRIYQQLVNQADEADPADNPVFKTYDDVVTRIIQLAPFNLLDGAWLRNIGVTGPIDEIRALLYSISMDELGDGDVSKNHCNIYLDLCHSVGYYPPPIDSREFAFDPDLLQSSFTVPAFQLAISQFSEEYYPEMLGMTLQLEWEVLDLKVTRDLLGVLWHQPTLLRDAHRHRQRCERTRPECGRCGPALPAERGVGRRPRGRPGPPGGASGTASSRSGTSEAAARTSSQLITDKPSLKEQMIAMIERKAEYGKLNHQTHTVGPTPINEWFGRPEEFLEALRVHDWITPGDWTNSRMNGAA